MHQVHKTKVGLVDRAGIDRSELDGFDALITNVRGVAIGVRSADCLPVLIYDPVNKAVAAVHSGWRGTCQKIVSVALLEMAKNFGTKPMDVKVVIGPGISVDSFQVGDEVASAFKEAGFPLEKIWSFRGPKVQGSCEGGHHIDLRAAVKFILAGMDVPSANIYDCNIDTFTNPEFFSARRDGLSAGRIISSIMLR
ncbi:MAG: peptidoglycan editing factor PgeF [Bacteroidales bacterium]|nr:peptidoglycan editing factor PgeF [Bacteroidales bacterium]